MTATNVNNINNPKNDIQTKCDIEHVKHNNRNMFYLSIFQHTSFFILRAVKTNS